MEHNTQSHYNMRFCQPVKLYFFRIILKVSRKIDENDDCQTFMDTLKISI